MKDLHTAIIMNAKVLSSFVIQSCRNGLILMKLVIYIPVILLNWYSLLLEET